MKLFKKIFALCIISGIISCSTYRPHYVDFNSLQGNLIKDNSDSISVWAYPIHPDTSDMLFDYGNWFLGYYPPKRTDNILHKGYQPYYLNIKNHGSKTISYNSLDQPDFTSGRKFHKKTRTKHWLVFGVSTGISSLLAVIQPAFFLPFFGTLFVGYTVPNLFYNLGLNGKRKGFIDNLSPGQLNIDAGKTDSLVVFGKISDKTLQFKLKSSDGKNIDIPLNPSIYRSRFFKFNGLNAMVMREGDSLTEVGQKLDISPLILLSFNDLDNNEKIAVGDTFYLEPKRKYAIQKSHTVGANETAQLISQKYGISKESLYKLNAGINIDSLQTGQVLKLNRQN